MNIITQVQTTHTIELADDERFEILSATGQIARVSAVYATQDSDGNWSVSASGVRIMKSGKVSGPLKIDTWWHSRSFSVDGRVRLINALSDIVRDQLYILGAITRG